jgi:hypothetical protein
VKNSMKVKDESVTPKMPKSAGSRAPLITPVEGLHTVAPKLGKLAFKPVLQKRKV